MSLMNFIFFYIYNALLKGDMLSLVSRMSKVRRKKLDRLTWSTTILVTEGLLFGKKKDF